MMFRLYDDRVTPCLGMSHPTGVRGLPDPILDRSLHETVTACRVGALVDTFQVVAVGAGERQIIVHAQGRMADGTWLTTL
jgi:hypothetical protein